jgi:hypothetical protein
MKAVASAVLVLAAAVLFGTGAIAEATLTAASRFSMVGVMGMVGGTLIGLVGLTLLALSLSLQKPPQGSP